VISGFEIDDASKEAGVKTTIQSALNDYFWSREPYIVGLSVPPRRDRITRAAVSGIVDTIVNAELGAVTSVEVKISGDDIAAYALDKGEKAKTGTVSYA
jgi:hypothetical protein